MEEWKLERERNRKENKYDRDKGRKRPDPRLRSKRYRNQQKAVATVANELKDRARELYFRCFPFSSTLPPIRLFWGDGSFSHTGHGHPPCPNKGLRDRLEPFFSGSVQMVSERNTSKSSPCCDLSFGLKQFEGNECPIGSGRTEPSFVGVKLIDKKPGKQRAFRCLKDHYGWDGKKKMRCNRPWHRDIGASMNMYRNWKFLEDVKEQECLEANFPPEDDLPLDLDLPLEDLPFEEDLPTEIDGDGDWDLEPYWVWVYTQRWRGW